MTHMIKLLAALAVTAPACTDAPSDRPDEGATEVARVDDAHGSLRFLAEPDGTVGFAGRTDLRRTDAEYLLAVEHATPLEVYLALAPADHEVPDALVANHRLLAGDAAPRALALPAASASGTEPFADCTHTEWLDFLDGVQGPYTFEYSRWVSTSDDIWTQSISDSKVSRRFDACAANDVEGTAIVQIYRKTNNTVVWSPFLSDQISPNERFWFTSVAGSFPDWMMSVQQPSNGDTQTVGLGRAES